MTPSASVTRADSSISRISASFRFEEQAGEARAPKIPYLTFSLGYSKKESFRSNSHFTILRAVASELNDRNCTGMRALKMFTRVESFAVYQNLYCDIFGKCSLKCEKFLRRIRLPPLCLSSYVLMAL